MLRPVPLNELIDQWPKVKKFLERLFKKHPTDGYIIEDVYAMLVSGTASLYVADECDGFAIFQVLPSYSRRRLHIWIAHCDIDPIVFQQDAINLAKANGCYKITFQSPRKGWDKRASKLGFKAVSTNYEMSL